MSGVDINTRLNYYLFYMDILQREAEQMLRNHTELVILADRPVREFLTGVSSVNPSLVAWDSFWSYVRNFNSVDWEQVREDKIRTEAEESLN